MADLELFMLTQGFKSKGYHLFQEGHDGTSLCGYRIDGLIEVVPSKFNLLLLHCDDCKQAYADLLQKAWDDSTPSERFQAFKEVSDIITGED